MGSNTTPPRRGGTRRSALVVAIVAVAALMAPTAASADPPLVNEFKEVIDFPFFDPLAGDWVCGFPVFGQDTISVRETTYFNNDGSLKRFRVHINGSTLWTSLGGDEVWENWAWTGTFDPDTGTFTQNGNRWNAHMGAGGILVNGSGHVVFDFSNGPFDPGDILVGNGPTQDLDGDFSGLCGALA